MTKREIRRLTKRNKPNKPKVGTMNRILIILGIVLGVYVIAVFATYWHTGGEPSTLTACLFGLCTAEGGFMSLIQTNKVKQSGKDTEAKEETKADASKASRAGEVPDDGTLL